MRTKKLQRNLKIFLFLFFAACIGYIFFSVYKLKEYDTSLQEAHSLLTENQKLVYVAMEDIPKGTNLEENVNVEKQRIYSGLADDNYMTEENLGSISIVDIKKGNPIMQNTITPLLITTDSREYEMQVVNLMTDQHENDFVDIRIMFPNGEDYLILSKKQIKNLRLDSCVFFSYLTEEEILRMASATIDAFQITGTRIYSTRYIESNLQEASMPNYLVRPETIDLMNSDPNILEKAQRTLNVYARIELEQRLGSLTEDQLNAVASGHLLEDTAKKAVLVDSTKALEEGIGLPEENSDESELEATTDMDTNSETETAEGEPQNE